MTPLHLQLLLLISLASSSLSDFPFRNTSLPRQLRVRDLVQRLTAAELVEQLSRGGIGPVGGPAPGISRLGIGPYQWNTECLRGAVQAGSATSFPQALGLAATFDPELLAEVANATGFEVRSKHNDYVRAGSFADHTGLSCFAPVINIMRHPFWGRNQETYGEDPFLTGTLAEAFVKGLQTAGGRSGSYLLASAGCKHFAAYDGPDSYPISRFAFNANVSEQDLQLTFLPQFQRCVQAGSRSVMCSYNSVNGVPACSNRRLLTDVLRQKWGFDGYVISDAGAFEFAIIFHKFFNSRLDAAVGSFRAGVNIELSACPYKSCIVFSYLDEAVNKSMISVEELRAAAEPLFATRMALGEFDPSFMNPFASLRSDQFVQSDQHQSLSLRAAQSSMVLLKNSDSFLPGQVPANTRLGVIGPLSDRMSLVYGWYSATRMPEFEIRLLDGLKNYFSSVQHREFCMDGVTCTRKNESAVQDLLQATDVIILALGTSTYIETESLDRQTLRLPAGQEELLRILTDSGKPIIILIVSGGPVDLDSAQSSNSVKAILWCGYPAQTFGAAVTSILTGQFAPYASLPFTWYSVANALPDITNYDMRNQTYRYANESDPAAVPLYHFGHGLSFCRIALSNITLTKAQITAGEDLNFSLQVSNRAQRSCSFTLKAYVAPAFVTDNNPRRWLASVLKVELPASSIMNPTMRVLPRELQLWDSTRRQLRQLGGNYRLYVGDYFNSTCTTCRVQADFSVIG